MIKVLSSGIYTAVHDLGRTGYREMGIPVAGVMDRYATMFANMILNNKEEDAVIEIVFGSSKFEFLESCSISISGADFSAKIDNEFTLMNTVLEVEKGSVLSFGKRNFGVRTYIAVKGGFLTETVLGSRGFYKGITNRHVFKKGVIIPINKEQKKIKETRSKVKFNKDYIRTNNIEVFEGPEYELLSIDQKEKLKQLEFTISSSNSRMGYILNEKIKNSFPSMLSSGVLPGTVQLTPSGKLIVLMRDCQVTGGYPRILQLTEESINILSQKTTKDSIKFKIKRFS